MNAAVRQSGFTLLEVLVALSLVGVLMTLVYTGMHIGLRSWDAVRDRSESAVVERATRNWLQRQVAALVPVRWQEGNKVRIAFAGDRNGFRFLGPWAHATRGGGLYHIELRGEESDDGLALRLAYQARETEKPELAGVGAVAVRRLEDRFAALEFDFFGAPSEREPRRWRRSWPSQAEQYPELIRIQGRRRDDRAWPRLVITVRNLHPERVL